MGCNRWPLADEVGSELQRTRSDDYSNQPDKYSLQGDKVNCA